MTDDKRLTPRAQAAAPGPDEAPITVSIEPQPREVVAQILSSLAIAEDVGIFSEAHQTQKCLQAEGPLAACRIS